MKIDLDKLYTACFTGYRPQKCPWGFNEADERCQDMKRRLKLEIEDAIQRGIKIFLCGMALGFDTFCAEAVLELKKKYPDIKLIGALPCRDQDRLWQERDKKRYRNLLKQLDDVYCEHEHYEDGCMQERNQFIIDNSSLCIALFDGKSGGTKNTVNYAYYKGLAVAIVRP